MDALHDIVGRAIAYTNNLLNLMPTYRPAAISGLRTLRAALAARQSTNDPAFARLDEYLESLDGKAERGESALTPSERLL